MPQFYGDSDLFGGYHARWRPIMMEKKPFEKRSRNILFALLAALALLLAFALGWFSHWLSLGERARSLLWAVRTAVNNYYEEVDENALYDKFFDDLALDPYSEYYTREEFQAVLRADEGHNADTGISLLSSGDDMRIYRVVGNSSADRAGLYEGMYIHRFGSSADDLREGTQAEFIAFVRTSRSFAVECGYAQDRSDAAVYLVESAEYEASYCLYRDNACAFRVIDGGHVAAAVGPIEELPDDAAYLRLERFYGNLGSEVRECLSYMKEHNKSRLILDLRLNGGGLMSVLQAVCAPLMKDAEGTHPLVATAVYRNGKEDRFCATGNTYGNYFGDNAHIYVLADENTASASECLIGALVSYHSVAPEDIFLRAEDGVARTYGKGIMQSHFTDLSGNALKLTTARIYWPNGTTIHGKGVTEEMGARALSAPLLNGERGDEMLSAVLALL